MKRFLFLVVAMFALGTWQSFVYASDLAEKLPADTAFYAHGDIGKALQLTARGLPLIDEEHGNGLIAQIKELHGAIKELAAQQEFTAKILDQTTDLNWHIVVLTKAHPEVITTVRKIPKWDRKTGKIVPGEFNEFTTKKTTNFSVSVILESPEDISEDLMVQLKKLIQRKHEKSGNTEEPAWQEIEVEQGEMIMPSSHGEKGYLGRHGRYIVLSETNPRELWANLTAAPEQTLAQTELYRRFNAGANKPIITAFVGIKGLLLKAEQEMRATLAQAQKDAASADGKKQPWRVAVAQSSLDTYLIAKHIFSLDKLNSCGISVRLSATDQAMKSHSLFSLYLDEPISPALALILDGGKPLQAPNVGEQKGLAIMSRMGSKDLLAEILKGLTSRQKDQFDLGMAMAKAQIGVTVVDILNHLAGDSYIFMDINKREYEKTNWKWDQKNKKMNKTITKVVGPLPEFLFLLGLNDPEAMKQMLSRMFTTISGKPQLGQYVKKRTYQETDVYLVGNLVGKEGANPDGLYSYAAVVLGRHLSFGSWQEMTALIRRAKASDTTSAVDPIAKIIAENQQANFIMGLPKTFNKRLQEMLKKEGDKEPLEALLEKLEKANFSKIEDKDLAERIRGILKKLAGHIIALQRKAEQTGRPYASIVGKKKGNFYEMVTEDEFTKQ